MSCCSCKSYIRHLVDKKWVHVVTVHEAQTELHGDLTTKLFQHAQSHACDKNAMVALRDIWLKELHEGVAMQELGSDDD